MQSLDSVLTRDGPRRGRSRSTVRVLLLVGLALVQTGGASARIEAHHLQPPEPLGEDIAAEGVSTIPFDPIAWRVVRDTALDAETAPFLERALGFAIADQGALVIADQAGGPGVTVEQGAAGFIPEAAIQQHATASSEPVSYVRIGLVPPVDATYTAGAELVYPGEGFAAPEGERRLILYRYELGDGDEIETAATGVPALVVVTVGTVEVDTADGASAAVAVGEAAAFSGDLHLTNGGPEDAVVYLATIDELETEPGGPGADGNAQVRVFASGCPADEPAASEEFEAYDAACREPIVGAEFTLNVDGRESPETTQRDIAAPTQGIAVWPDVAPGEIVLTGADVPGYGPIAAFCRDENDEEDPQPVQNLAFTLDPGDALACHIFFRPGDSAGPDSGNGSATDDGRITIQLRRCPADVTEVDLPAAKGRCAEDFAALQLVLLGDGIDGQRRNADWEPAVAGMAWTDLPLGEYRIVFAPPGAAMIMSETDADALGEWTANTAKTYPVTLTVGNPEVILQVYVFSA